MTRKALGDLEHQVLWASLRLGGNAYSVSVVREIEERTGREVAQSAVFIALRRLEEKGFMRSNLHDQAGERGRDRRYFEMTPAGLKELREMRRTLTRLWEGLLPELGGKP